MIETMSEKEMTVYQGKRKKPDGFDSFWSQQIETVNKLNPIRVSKRDFSTSYVDCFDLSFKSANGSNIYAKYLRPKTSHKVPVIFHFHGYQGRSSDWSEYFKFILAGYAVVAMDVRGQSGLSTDNGNYSGVTVKGQVIRGMLEGTDALFFKDIYLDVYQLIEIVSKFEEVDETQLITYGASQGGALALIGNALHEKVTKTISIYPFLSDFERVLDLKLTCEPYDELFRYFKYVDPFYHTKETVLSALDYIDVKNFSHLVTGEVKMVTGLRDDICVPSTQYAIYNQLKAKKEHLILPEYGHEAMTVFMNDQIMNWITGERIGEN